MIRLIARASATLAVSVLAACGGPALTVPVGLPAPAPSLTVDAVAAPSPAPPPADCPYPDSGFDCSWQQRFAAVQQYVAGRPGTVGIVLRDRQTGAVWRNDHAGDMVWTASTIKLAMVVDLLTRQRSGEIRLTPADRSRIDAMLKVSDDAAATALWKRYSGDRFTAAFPGYGMTSLRAEHVPGEVFPFWGFQKCTADDLDRLMTHVLTALPPADRAFIVDRMRAVGPVQRWGVWGAGTQARPGVKAGWSQEDSGWVMNSVGFVGPAERYTLAVMNDLHDAGGYDEGRRTVTETARLLFDGRF